MKKICDIEIINPVQTENGFVFMTPKSNDGENTVINYKIYDFSTNEITPVTRSVYLLNKFGINFESFQGSFKRYLNCNIIGLPAKRQAVIDDKGLVEIYDNFSTVLLSKELCYDSEAPCDAFCTGNDIWMSYKNSACLIKYSVSGLIQQFRIGGKSLDSFGTPEGIWADEKKVLFCDSKNHKISQIDLDEFEISDYFLFDEPVHKYFKYKADEIVFLDSGAYIL
ncbi:MAG: hypothetical protein IJ462_00950 [Clostridia bacterium]|nr:hypothetical protein [Clostridia bacterium]